MIKTLSQNTMDFAKRALPTADPGDIRLKESYYQGATEELSQRVFGGKAGGENLEAFLRGTADDVTGATPQQMDALGMVRTQMQEGAVGGEFYSRSAIGDMYNNAKDGQGVFGGLSGAGRTESTNSLFSMVGGGPMSSAGDLGGILVSAGLGAGAANLVGGDRAEGAMYGMSAAMIGKAATRTFRDALPGIEESVMKRALGDNFVSSSKILGGGGISRGNRAYMDSGDIIRDNKITGTLDPTSMNELQRRKMARPGYKPFTNGRTVEIDARSQNLEALKKVDTTDMNVMDRFLVNRMNDPAKASIGGQSRSMIASGALLGGAVFSSSRTKNKSRGFNQNRGSRF